MNVRASQKITLGGDIFWQLEDPCCPLSGEKSGRVHIQEDFIEKKYILHNKLCVSNTRMIMSICVCMCLCTLHVYVCLFV